MTEIVPWLAFGLSVVSALAAFVSFLISIQRSSERKVDFDYYDARHEGFRRDIDEAFKYIRSDFERQLYRMSERVRYLEIRAAQRDGRPLGTFNGESGK